MRKTTWAIGLALTVPAAVVYLVTTTSAAPGGGGAASRPASDTVTIDPQVGETFTPVDPKEARGIIGASEAYRRFSDGANIPGNFSVQLGYLTFPVGEGAPGQYNAKDELVYAYTADACGPQLPPISTSEGKPSKVDADGTCTQWLFMDASSGDMVDLTWTH